MAAGMLHNRDEGLSNRDEGLHNRDEGLHNRDEGLSNHDEGLSNHDEGLHNRDEGLSNHEEGLSNHEEGLHNHEEGDVTIALNDDLSPALVRIWKHPQSSQPVAESGEIGEGKRNRPQFLAMLGGARGFGKRANERKLAFLRQFGGFESGRGFG